jgi:hypothetical protein
VRQFFTFLVALLLGGAAVGGVRTLSVPRPAGPVVPAQSAALFVGVREFPYDHGLAEVQYAVDDAVDLAHVLAIDLRTRLVDPRRVVLALSGKPQKAESRRRLETLVAGGATVRSAAQPDVLTLLQEQARAVGPNGVLIVAFATHGISIDGTQYLLTASSLLQHRETGIAETKVREIVSRMGVPRSIILLDACRERLTTDVRSVGPRSIAAAMRAIGDINGQVVFSAAAAGDYAYDDVARGNGVFTAAVIDGLQCRAPTDADGFVTVDTLSSYVEEQVLTWVRRNRDPDASRATQLHCEGRSRKMPLLRCPRQISDTARAFPPRAP